MKLHIVDQAKAELIQVGLAGWTLDRIAARANCAKGLITYHHSSRSALLGTVTGQLRSDRMSRRASALRASGASAIDALWRVLLAEHASGESAAWSSLLGSTDSQVREGRRPVRSEVDTVGGLLVEALSLETDAAAVGSTSVAALDGFAAALLQGLPVEQVREGYHRFWLGLLG